jgi:hypothetical protein
MTRRHQVSSASPREGSPTAARFAGWEARIYPGLQLASAPPDVQQELASALGAVGVEAEYLLRLLADFPGAERPSGAAGEALLARVAAFAERLIPLAEELEVATQSFINAVADDAGLFGEPAHLDQLTAQAEPWWPPFAGWWLEGEPLGLRLRRCGLSYRQLVAVRLPDTLEAVAERMALVLHALRTLPPAGTVPAGAVTQGLAELADTVQGDVVLHFIRDLGPEYPGLTSAIARLRRLAANEDTSIAGDLAWARQQYAAVAGVTPPAPGPFARLFGSGARRAAPGSAGTARWAEQASADWRALIAALEALQAEAARTSTRGGRQR